jgi:hypothetical protein
MKKIIPFIIVILILLAACEEKTTESSSSPDENEAHFSYPLQGTNVSGNIYFKVTGTNIDYVCFGWLGNWTTDETEPYQRYCVTSNYSNGEYTIRASVVFDDGSSTSFTVDFWINN